MTDDQSERWVYGFKQTGHRLPTEPEIQAVIRCQKNCAIVRVAWAALCVVLALIGLFGIIIAADSQPFGWWVLILGMAAAGWALGKSSATDEVGLLMRRAARVGKVDIFERKDASIGVRVAYRFSDNEDDDRGPNHYWKEEESFLERLSAFAGRSVDGFETPDRDDVVLFVDKVLVKRTLFAPSVRLRSNFVEKWTGRDSNPGPAD